MAAGDYRTSYHRLIVAENFLRNISFDGSYVDTTLHIFNKRGLPIDYFCSKKFDNNKNLKSNHKSIKHVDNSIETISLSNRRHSSALPIEFASTAKERYSRRSPSSCVAQSSQLDNFDASVEESANPLMKTKHKLIRIIRRQSSTLDVKFAKAKEDRQRFRLRWQTVSTTFRDSVTSSSSDKLKIFQKIANFLNLDTREQVSSLTSHENSCSAMENPSIQMQTAQRIKNNTLTSTSRESEPSWYRQRRQSLQENNYIKPFELEDKQEVSYQTLINKPMLSPPKRFISVPLDAAGSKHNYFISRASPPVTPLRPDMDLASAHNDALLPHAAYDATLFDDAFIPDSHKTTLALPSYISSIIDYINPTDLKKEINEKFRKKFPDIQLTYSKFRSLKKELRRIAEEAEMDSVTLAHAYIYFEKVVYKAAVSKSNRKLVAGACMILAAKLNDFKGERLNVVIEKVEQIFRLNRRDLFSYELPVAVSLDFSLHLSEWEIYPHYQRLIWSA